MLDIASVLVAATLLSTPFLRRSRPARSVAVWGAAALLCVALVWKASSTRGWGPLAERIRHGPRDRPVVALTLDDGPTEAYTDRVLDLLAAADARATFFVTGRELAANPDLGRRILADGHELGNHSWSHPRLLFPAPGAARRELADTDAELHALGVADPWFRPPYGKGWLDLGVALRGRPMVTWALEPDSHPELTADPEALASWVLERVQPGDIVLLHVMYRSRETERQALPLILDGLRRRGLGTVTVSELLDR